jgi:hypothetical protein
VRRALIGLVCGALLAATPARAGDVDQARALYVAGVAAYDKHDYQGAIQAFEGAEKLSPRTSIVFALAQAHRRQFYVDGNAAHQRAAIDLFREYVKRVPSGGRHEDAMRALQELGALGAPQQDLARVSINSSGTPGARVSLDGAPAVEAPLIGPVSAGKHHAVISADGFVSETRDITAVNGQIVALDVPLKEKLARVQIAALSGAAVEVDGRPMGETPLRTPLELPPGAHVVAVTKNGHDAFVTELAVGRGEQRRLTAALPTSKQRTIAIGFFVASAAAAAGAGVCAGLEAYYFGQAQRILDKQKQQNIDLQDVAAYDDARTLRADFLVAAGLAFAGAAVLAATGVVLFVFDKPNATGAPRVERKEPKPREGAPEPLDVAVVPLVSPYVLGASAEVRF